MGELSLGGAKAQARICVRLSACGNPIRFTFTYQLRRILSVDSVQAPRLVVVLPPSASVMLDATKAFSWASWPRATEGSDEADSGICSGAASGVLCGRATAAAALA